MRKVLCGVLMLVAAAALPTTLAGDPEVNFSAEVWNRVEHTENYTDFEDTVSGGGMNDTLDFGMYRVRAGMNVKAGDMVSALIEFQNVGNWGNTVFPYNPQDPNAGPTDLTSISNTNDVVLYQAKVNLDHIGGSLFSLSFGRMEKTLGNELHIGDADFYSGQYFDGIDANFDFESWMLNAFYFTVEERNLFPGSTQAGGFPFNGGSDDRYFGGVTANFDIAEGHNLEPYVLYGRDGNEASGGGGFLSPKYSIWTIGALYQREREFEGAFDWALELASQSGDVGVGAAEVDQSSYIAEGSFGYTFGDEAASHHRVGVGALIIGDGDSTTEVESFMNLYPDTHRRAGLGDVFTELSTSNFGVDTFHNLTNIFIEWDWHGDSPHSFGAAYHTFTATEDFGATEDHYGDELDAWYNLQSGDHFNLQLGLADFMPEEDLLLGEDDVLRIYAMGRFRM